jgi:8-oxo-dGTP pyrophosphatase MutT (NUDIX family)
MGATCRGTEQGESVLEAAEREVLEATGNHSFGYELIYSYFPMNGRANQMFHIVPCRAGERVQAFDQNEVTQTKWFTRAEAKEMIKDRSLTDGFTITALLLWLAGEKPR